MRNLLRVSFRRWLHSRFVWGCSLGILCVSIFNCISAYHEKYIGFPEFNSFYYPVLMIAALLFTGAAILLNLNESDPYRNAVIAGYSKSQVFLSEVIPAVLFGLCAALCMLLPMLRGIHILKPLPGLYLLFAALSTCIMFCGISALTVTIAMNCKIKAVGIIAAALFILAGFIFANPLCNALMKQKSFPKYDVTLSEDGKPEYVYVGEDANPEYLPEPDRTRVTILSMILPQTAIPLVNQYLETSSIPHDASAYDYQFYSSSSANWIATQSESMLRILPLCELGMLLIFAGFGIYMFRKTDMK